MPGEAEQMIVDLDMALDQFGTAASIYTQVPSGTTSDAYVTPTGITRGDAQNVKMLWKVLSEAEILKLGGEVTQEIIHVVIPKTYNGTAITFNQDCLIVRSSVDYKVIRQHALNTPEIGGSDVFYTAYITRGLK